MADTDLPSEKTEDADKQMTEETKADGSDIDESMAGEISADDIMEEEILRSDGPTADQPLGIFHGDTGGEDGAKEEDPIKTSDQELPFDDISAVLQEPEDISQVESAENEPSPDLKPDSNADIEMTDAGTEMTDAGTSTADLPEDDPPEAIEKEPSSTSLSTHSSDLEITWQDVLMGDIRPSEGLLYLQLKATPPLIPIECWTPFLHTLNDAIDNLVKDCINQITFLDSLILCRISSQIPSSHPSPISCLIFQIENCLKTTHKAVVLKVSDDILTQISCPENMAKMHLSPFEEHAHLHDKGVFREEKMERATLFGEFLAKGRSEGKLEHAVRGFLLEDQRGRLVKIAPRRVRTFRS